MDTGLLIKIIGNVGSFFLFFAFLFSNVLLMRFLTLLSGVLMIVYFLFISVEPLWINIFWKGMLLCSATWGLIRYGYDHRTVHFSTVERAIKKRNFSYFSDAEFKQLLNFGVLRNFAAGDVLIRQNQEVNRLFLLVEGAVAVTDLHHDDVVLTSGQFVGEMSFLSGNLASATARVANIGCECLYWMQSDLAALDRSEPELYKKLHDCFSVDVVQKLKRIS